MKKVFVCLSAMVMTIVLVSCNEPKKEGSKVDQEKQQLAGESAQHAHQAVQADVKKAEEMVEKTASKTEELAKEGVKKTKELAEKAASKTEELVKEGVQKTESEAKVAAEKLKKSF